MGMADSITHLSWFDPTTQTGQVGWETLTG